MTPSLPTATLNLHIDQPQHILEGLLSGQFQNIWRNQIHSCNMILGIWSTDPVVNSLFKKTMRTNQQKNNHHGKMVSLFVNL